MKESSFSIIDSPCVSRARELDNYKIEIDPTCNNRKSCTVYFTSNALYYPNTEENFCNEIYEKDKYEWYKTRRISYKHIFLRDVYKQWYIRGINSRIDSIPVMADWLREETAGYEDITVVGSSAGGFISIVIGHYIQAKKVIAFNPQVNLVEELKKGECELWKRSINNSHVYLDISRFLTKKVVIFSSVRSEVDVFQYRFIASSNANVLRIDSNTHGVPIAEVEKAINVDLDFYRRISHKWIYSEEEFCRMLTSRTYSYFCTKIPLFFFWSSIIPLHKLLYIQHSLMRFLHFFLFM